MRKATVLLVFLVGCGSGGMGSEMMVPAATGGAAGVEMDSGAGGTGGAATGGAPGTGGAQAGGGGGAMAGGTGGASAPAPDASPPAPDTGAPPPPDTAPQPAQACASESGLTVSGCGYLGPGSKYVFRKMGGANCRACSVQPGGRQVVGCAPEPGHVCVAACGACCYDTPATPCTSAADCCAPLQCKPNGAGGMACQ